GIDQDCNGIDQPLGTVADAAESDDSIATAKDMVEAGGSAYEIIYRRDIYEGNGRTLHTVGDVDFFRVVVPAWGQLEVNVVDYDVSLNAIFYDADGIEVGTGGGYYDLTNATSSPATFYVKYSASDGTSTGWYVPYFVNLGTDQDQDTYYTGNWSGSRDCNDGNASIYDGALETESDSIDSNCDGADGTATVTYPESYPPAGPMQPAGALGSHHPAKARR
ncbi:MAG: putative metal-binding motif-containing protein, partial [Candidatus Lambdaproteobacteria bacterium]|nr:putative metal-binding motif-containing protein [Candidatus Lambdaproteobacteria bacterium]